MKSKDKKYILENSDTKSVKELSQELGLKERTVRKFLERKKEKGIISIKTSFINKQEGLAKDNTWKALSVVILIGFVLRALGITWGIPILDPLEGFYHPDQVKIIAGAVTFPQHIIENTVFQYPTFYHYFIGIFFSFCVSYCFHYICLPNK